MLRQPPTAIVLGRSDFRDFDRRRQRHQETELFNQRNPHILPVRASTRSIFPPLQAQAIEDEDFGEDEHKLQTGDGEQAYYRQPYPTVQTNELLGFNPDLSSSVSMLVEGRSSAATDLQDEHASSNIGTENPARDSQQSPSPAKDAFYYGGFVERPSERVPESTPHRTSPFAPDDISTPHSIQLPDATRLRNRLPLPRSPLFLSQNASISPEYHPTTGLTPHVASRVAIHSTPGVMFSQPARRMRRPPQKTFRHQSNSFSFDSAERSSAAYEQERVSSTSTNESTLRQPGELSLQEELRGSSLQSSRATSGVSYAGPDPLAEGFSAVRIEDESAGMVPAEGEPIISSPQLPLPPPFSTVPRSVSGAESLPGMEYMPPNPRTSPIRSSSLTTPPKYGVESRHPSLNFDHESTSTILESVGEVCSSPPLVNGISPRSLIRRAADSVIDFYRTRTPVSRRGSPMHPSPTPSPTPRRGQSRHVSPELPPRTPCRTYRVYNDSLPGSVQPQTPAHLPEARHQSRFHPSYTAPVSGGIARRAAQRMDDSRTREDPSMQRIQQLYTPIRRGVGRSASPMGVSQSGFAGLYGGRENTDEEQNWAEGVRFSYAETRLWGLRDARNDGTSLRETPEPDDWRVGRRQE